MSTSSNRVHHVDQLFEGDLINEKYSNCLIIRGVAKGKKFKGIDFKYTIFETCYFRKCSFEDCDFTGCRFNTSNLYGSIFQNCKFDYVVFERTQITPEILDTNCPGLENLKLKFARSLRTNFQSLGDSEAVNKAMAIELDATEAHLFKAWNAPESYYRHKYRGWGRVKVFFQWLSFKILDLLWGNGESSLKLLRAVLAMLMMMALIHVIFWGDPSQVRDYWLAVWIMPQVLLGVLKPLHYPDFYLTIIMTLRLLAFGFFLSILIKRFNRR